MNGGEIHNSRERVGNRSENDGGKKQSKVRNTKRKTNFIRKWSHLALCTLDNLVTNAEDPPAIALQARFFIVNGFFLNLMGPALGQSVNSTFAQFYSPFPAPFENLKYLIDTRIKRNTRNVNVCLTLPSLEMSTSSCVDVN